MKFEEGKVIGRIFVPKGKDMMEIVIRFPKKTEAFAIWKFFNKVIRETEFLFRVTPVSLEEERKWLAGMIRGSKHNNRVYLVAECGKAIIGSVSITREAEASRHVGDYGICILQEYTGLGIGTKLTKCAIKLAKSDMKLEIIKLNVYSKNKIALNLYKKMGFIRAGKIPKGVKKKSGYMDNIIMYKVIK